MSDLFIKNCMLENGEKVDILILKGKIADISSFIQGVSESIPEIDAEGWQSQEEWVEVILSFFVKIVGPYFVSKLSMAI